MKGFTSNTDQVRDGNGNPVHCYPDFHVFTFGQPQPCFTKNIVFPGDDRSAETDMIDRDVPRAQMNSSHLLTCLKTDMNLD